MFDLAALERAERALSETTGLMAAKVSPQGHAICPVTAASEKMRAGSEVKRNGFCPVAHAHEAAHG